MFIQAAMQYINTHLLHTVFGTDDNPSLLDEAICPRRSWVNVNMNPVDCVMCYMLSSQHSPIPRYRMTAPNPMMGSLTIRQSLSSLTHQYLDT